MKELHRLDYKSPIGVVEIQGTDEAVYSILFNEENQTLYSIETGTPRVLVDCMNQLDEYFNGTRQKFSFPVMMEGTGFQKSVWESLTSIPYGQTRSYKDIAVLIGNGKAVRAVGITNGRNKLNIVVPCHRVIGTNGKLTGYAGGLWRKEWLLNHEKSNPAAV